MNWPSVDEFKAPKAKGRYLAILRLQCELNRQLLGCYEEIQHQDIEYVSTALLSKVDDLVEQLNAHGYKFGRFDYGGDKDFERSQQTYYDRKWDRHNKTLGAGLMIQFRGFSAHVKWLDHQKKKGR
jgi:hypothetical protein